MVKIDEVEYSRLRASLVNARIATTNNPLYQTILGLIGAAEKFAQFTKDLAVELIPVIPKQIETTKFLFGLDGIDGEDGLIGQIGPRGPQGLIGPIGPDGIDGMDYEQVIIQQSNQQSDIDYVSLFLLMGA